MIAFVTSSLGLPQGGGVLLETVPGLDVVDEGPGQALGRLNLAELALERVLGAVGVPEHVAPGAAFDEVHVATCERVPPRAPPPGHVLAAAVCLEDQVTRCVKGAGHDGFGTIL